MLDYYEQRQPEYEAIYAKPERQQDLRWLEDQLLLLTADKSVLEIACGTGYWTKKIAATAREVTATDASEALVNTTQLNCKHSNVTTKVMDAFSISAGENYNCVLGGFFISHVLIEQQQQFMTGIAHAMRGNTKLVFFDNRYVEGSSTPVARTDNQGNQYQTRKLSDGSKHEVLKNFLTASQLKQLLEICCRNVCIQESKYFWLATGQLR